MADDHKNFTNAPPLMLFGESFMKQAATMVEQVKAIKKLQEKKSLFSSYHPRSYQNGRRGGGKSSCTSQGAKPVIPSIASCRSKNN